MKNINFHIAYLLSEHECVVIPDFGAFIVSHFESAKPNQWGILAPPDYSLSFNSEIRHNDGLLINSLALEKGISYGEAALLVGDFVKTLKNLLANGQTITLPFVGSLVLSLEDKILFKPATNLSCNAGNFGLTNFYLSRIKELKEGTRPAVVPLKRKQTVKTGRIIGYGLSAAAAALALFLVSAPLNNYPLKQNVQRASVIPVRFPETINPAPATPATVAAAEPAVAEKPAYYLVVAGFYSRKSAEKAVGELLLEKEDIGAPQILETGKRFLIYVDAFSGENEAEQFLKSFRAESRKHKDAWLYRAEPEK
ncbi:MAG: hypothetical protein LBR64_07230 [Dysgonamonadaceae bacterium]|jgi:nucleoid DNA-binding protein|nr:hypothetical protein [Dysgonamonadaceae bacterium]